MTGKMVFGLLALMVMGLVVTAGASAMPGIWKDNEAAQSALNDRDYDGFVDAIGDDERSQRFVEHLTEERFEEIADRHAAHEEVKSALESEDYDAWRAAMENAPHGEEILDLINEGNFAQLVEAHEAREAGDHETARGIAEELGLPKPKHGDCPEKHDGERRGPPGFGEDERRGPPNGERGPRGEGRGPRGPPQFGGQ